MDSAPPPNEMSRLHRPVPSSLCINISSLCICCLVSLNTYLSLHSHKLPACSLSGHRLASPEPPVVMNLSILLFLLAVFPPHSLISNLARSLFPLCFLFFPSFSYVPRNTLYPPRFRGVFPWGDRGGGFPDFCRIKNMPRGPGARRLPCEHIDNRLTRKKKKMVRLNFPHREAHLCAVEQICFAFKSASNTASPAALITTTFTCVSCIKK